MSKHTFFVDYLSGVTNALPHTVSAVSSVL